MPGHRTPKRSAPDSAWPLPAAHPPLPADEVHVWRAALDAPVEHVKRLGQLLAVEEQARAARFAFPSDRDRFVVGRGLLRILLGRYLDLDPRQVRFHYGSYGKPALPAGCGGLHFNLSHSRDLALVAVTRGRAVGVDLEWIRPEVAEEQIAEQFFAPREVAALRDLPRASQPAAFFACWTRKEAFIKARGDGLALPLDGFSVTLRPGETPDLLSTEFDPREASRWSLRELAPEPGTVAALAVEGHQWRLRCWQWPEWERG